jgi:hypothetical protein
MAGRALPRSIVVPFALAALLAAAPSSALQGFLYTRDVSVPAAGWVRVPLDLPALRHAAPGVADLRVLAPDGSEVPVRLEVSAPAPGRRRAAVTGNEQSGDGWTVFLDAGTPPAAHERLILTLADAPRAFPALRLEGSPDGANWEPLAAGEPVVGEREAGLPTISLSYPSTSDRFLRLRWPAPGGEPRIAAAGIETVSGPVMSLSTRGAECDRNQPAPNAICTIELPAAGQVLRRLILDLEGPGTVGYRLSEPRAGRWEPLAEGIWQRTGERSRHALTGGSSPLAGTSLRLELYGSGESAPLLASYGVDLAVPTLLFAADGPGRYTVAYGGLPRRDRREGARAPSGAGIAWLEMGPEREQKPPPLPSTPGPSLARIRFAASWPVAAPTAEPGDLVRLELPGLVYGAARSDLGDLRLATGAQGDQQLPFFRWSPPEPTPALEEHGLHPTEAERRGESQIVLDLRRPALPLTAIDLTAPGAPLRRPVGVRYVDSDRPGDPLRELQAIARDTWECVPEPPLPCRDRLSLPGRAPRLVTVRFHDGDNNPLPEVGATVWRRRDVLLFVWPKKGETVRLLAGSRILQQPSYDLAALGEALLARPWQPAELDLGGGGTKEGGLPWWSGWVRPFAMAVAAAALLLLLRRILSDAQAPEA